MTERDEVPNATVGDMEDHEYIIMIYLGMASYENMHITSLICLSYELMLPPADTT